ncbi:MAG: Acetyltransferase [Hyphomicrobiaceae bacterium hypho_1]
MHNISKLRINTARLNMRPWHNNDREEFITLHTDPVVMSDLGGVIDVDEAHDRFDRYGMAWVTNGFGWWVVQCNQRFLGYVGVMSHSGEHPLGSHNEIGWRMHRDAWGYGFTTEAVAAALHDVFTRAGLTEVLTYTEAKNERSQVVMERLNLKRDPKRDFSIPHSKQGVWEGLVWVITARDWNERNIYETSLNGAWIGS